MPDRGPVDANAAASRRSIDQIQKELARKFGGVTPHVYAPAEGLWKGGGSLARDRIVVVEVMTTKLHIAWWKTCRKQLERVLAQDEIVIRYIAIRRIEIFPLTNIVASLG